MQNDTFPRIYLLNGFQEIACFVWIQLQRSAMTSWKINYIQMDPVMCMVSFFKHVWSTVLLTCSAALWLLPLFPSHIIFLSLACWPYHVPVVTKILFHSWHQEFLFFQASTLQICFFQWGRFLHLFISFLLSHIFPLSHILLFLSPFSLLSPFNLFYTLSHLVLFCCFPCLLFLFPLSLWKNFHVFITPFVLLSLLYISL